VLVRQRPGTAKGVIFMTLEDEAGVANVIVWPKAFERLRALVIGARFVAVSGKLQNEAGVIHLIAERMEDWTPTLGQLSDEGRTIETLVPADEVKRPQLPVSKKRQGNRFAQVQLFAEPRPLGPAPVEAPAAPAPLAPELKRALPGGRNFR
jgi:error-prone DNA polymerase